MSDTLISTHASFLNTILGGGQRPVSVNGILSPTGVGKSTLASNIAVYGATQGPIFGSRPFNLFEAPKVSAPAIWVLFDLHANAPFSRLRTVSHAAKIQREDVYCRSYTIQEYEQNRKSELTDVHGKLVSSEHRFELAVYLLRRQLACMTSDWLHEPAEDVAHLNASQRMALELNCQSQKRKIGGIVIDGVGDAWDHDSDTSSLNERKFIHWFASDYCRQLCEKYQCPVWVTHQINTKASGASPLAPLSHCDAARCRSFADDLDACVVLGAPSDTDNVFSAQCTKGYQGTGDPPKLLLTHDVDFASIVQVHGFVADQKNQTWKKHVAPQAVVGDKDLEHIQTLLGKHREHSGGKHKL